MLLVLRRPLEYELVKGRGWGAGLPRSCGRGQYHYMYCVDKLYNLRCVYRELTCTEMDVRTLVALPVLLGYLCGCSRAVDICGRYPRPDPCLPGGIWDPILDRSVRCEICDDYIVCTIPSWAGLASGRTCMKNGDTALLTGNPSFNQSSNLLIYQSTNLSIYHLSIYC